jgi:hypothetical protein
VEKLVDEDIRRTHPRIELLITARSRITKHPPYKRGHEAQNLKTLETEIVSSTFGGHHARDSQNEGSQQQPVSDAGHYVPKPDGSPCREAKEFIHLFLV